MSRERLGPPTEAQTAGTRYSEDCDWPVGCTTRSVWICLPAHILALAVPEPLASCLTISGPAIAYPGNPRFRIYLVSRPRSFALRAAAHLFDARGVILLDYKCLVDLPPTVTPQGPLTWASTPPANRDLATLASIVDALHGTVCAVSPS
jgi:hypothetical protein